LIVISKSCPFMSPIFRDPCHQVALLNALDTLGCRRSILRLSDSLDAFLEAGKGPRREVAVIAHRVIVAVKAIVSKGSHVWIWNHIWQFSWDWFPLEICAHPRRNLPTGHRLSARGAVQASLLLGGLEAPPSNWQGCNVTDGFGDYCLSSAVLGGVRIRAAHAAVRSESG
jgi:hypothetical protein